MLFFVDRLVMVVRQIVSRKTRKYPYPMKDVKECRPKCSSVGVILFFYALHHLMKHSINVFSLESTDYVRENYFRFVWKSQVGTILL